MTRVLEFIVALIMVFILAVIVGLFLPSHAHIERSIDISHNPRHIYDVLNNFRRFHDYAGASLRAEDPAVKFELSGPAYGPGATVSWNGDNVIGDGTLVNKSGTIDLALNSTVTWALTNGWHGKNKTFTFQVTPREAQRVSRVTWSYDVDYGWNLIGRYSALWIHGEPSTMIQYGLDQMQNMLAAIPNVDYARMSPGIYKTDATPVLLISTKAARSLDDIDASKAAALKQVQGVMAKLGVKAAGPTTTITTEYGDTTYKFDLAVPINTTTLTIDGKAYDLTALPARPTADQFAAAPAASSSAGLPAAASSTGAAVAAVGSLDKQNQLIVSGEVRARMMPASEVLEATWTGEAGVPLMRLGLQAYASTHGYQFDADTNRLYDQLASPAAADDQDQVYRVFLPVQDAPAQTPEQIAGRTTPLTALDPSLWSTGAAAPAAEEKPEAKKPEPRKRPESKRRHRG